MSTDTSTQPTTRERLVSDLRSLSEKHRTSRRERDALIIRGRDDHGMTWVELGQATSMSPNGARIAYQAELGRRAKAQS